MDHRQLRFLVALAQERHFGRAAQRAHVTQPTLSARLKQLETELGTPLIRRGRRFEGFTPEGQRVLLHARRILAEFDELHAELDPARGPSGWLSLGLVPSALGDMAALLPGLRRRFPALRFRVREYTTVSLMQALADDEIELALGYLDVPAAEPFIARPLFEEHYVLMAAAGLAFSTPPDWTTLAHHPLYMLTGDMQHHSLVRRRLEEEGMAVEAVVEASSLALLAALLRTDQAIAVMPSRLVNALPLEGLVTWPLPALAHPARLGLLWKRAHRQSLRLQAVLDALSSFDDR